MKKLNIDQSKLYIIGVSGGPDSMALLDLCQKQGIQVICAHMNYQKRESAKRDMEIVQNYCDHFGITLRICMQDKECVGNFQAFARERRYTFYKELIQEFHGDGVLLAHQMDDHLETYFMQKEAHRFAHYFGIQKESRIQGCRIIRPLLEYTKEELMNYCDQQQVPYGIDESNLTNQYTRNRIRHTIIDQMSRQEKEEVLLQIKQENKDWKDLCAKSNSFLSSWDQTIQELRKLDETTCKVALFQWIQTTCKIDSTHKEIDQTYELLQRNANEWTRDIGKEYVIYSEYGKLCIDTKENSEYSFVYDCVTFIQTPYFRIVKQGETIEGVTLQEEDFPIQLRNAKKEDEIQLRFGTKRVNRWFIDRKIPKKERRKWPVLLNAQGNVIFVPKIGCDIAHFSNNPTCFVLK